MPTRAAIQRSKRTFGPRPPRAFPLWAAITVASGLLACRDPAPTGPLPNRAPTILSRPALTADHNRLYRYAVRAEDPDGDALTLSYSGPAWLEFRPAAASMEGVAGWDNLGPAAVSVRASDGSLEATQTFTIEVAVGEIDCDTEFEDPSRSMYLLPYPAGRTYTLFQGYCPPNPLWGHQSWFAYDFDLATGDTVVAARGGDVIVVIEEFTDGTRVPGEENLIYVRHEDGSIAAYVHLTRDGALVEVGDRVMPGEPIGLSGDTGNSSGPHLHFHVFREGGFTRHYSLPIGFRNAAGRLNERGGPAQGVAYTALPADGTAGPDGLLP